MGLGHGPVSDIAYLIRAFFCMLAVFGAWIFIEYCINCLEKAYKWLTRKLGTIFPFKSTHTEPAIRCVYREPKGDAHTQRQRKRLLDSLDRGTRELITKGSPE